MGVGKGNVVVVNIYYSLFIFVDEQSTRGEHGRSHKVMQLINTIEQDKLSDEEYATLKRFVEKRVRETAQVTAVTRDATVQHCSPCSP